MNYNRVLNPILVLFLMMFVAIPTSFGQVEEKEKKERNNTDIAKLIESKNFVFVAQNVFPTGGRNINLTTIYEVKLSTDTVVTDLPYFGRAFVAPMNPSDGGIRFTSTKFDLDIKERKKGGWDIIIIPKDTRDVRQMYLTVSTKGYGTLQVVSNNRQNIRFSGYIASTSRLK